MTQQVLLHSSQSDTAFVSTLASSEFIDHALFYDTSGQAKLRITIDHPGKFSILSEAVFVRTSDPENPFIVVPVRAKFFGPVQAFPPSILVRNPGSDGEIVKTVDLVASTYGEFQVELGDSISYFMKSDIVPTHVPNRYQLRMVIDPSKMPKKVLSEVKVIFRDVDSGEHNLRIPFALLSG